jgi:hypothetical protein
MESWKAVDRAWRPVLERLRNEGFDIEERGVGIAFPVQLSGRLPTGESFYFRERSGHVWLGVGGDDPVVDPTWRVQFELRGSDMSEEFLLPEETYALLTRLLAER